MNSAISRILITVLAAAFAVLGLSATSTSAHAAETAKTTATAYSDLDAATYETRVQ